MRNALFVAIEGADAKGVARAEASLQRQGFAEASSFNFNGDRLRTWTFPGQDQVAPIEVRTPTCFGVCVGPLWYRGVFGNAALKILLEECEAGGRPEEALLRGNFALFLYTTNQCLLLNDPMGFVRLHASADGCFFSTSWLAACAYLSRVEIDAGSAIEYVLLGAAHSRHSVARGVDLLPVGQAWDLKQRRMWARFPDGVVSDQPAFASLDEAVHAISSHLRVISTEVVSAFPNAVNAALSGGFDSRLIVAGLLAAGIQPRLFVYGDPDSADVAIAKIVAAATGLSLDAIDKRVLDRGRPECTTESLEQSALFFDGLPSDGIGDPGADRQTRLQQTADGSIALNGGGGEIYRNFFHLPDRDFSPLDIVRTFYRGFSTGVFREPDGLDKYEERLAASIRDIATHAGGDGKRLTRRQVELLYPFFRCHFWMGLNNSVGVRHGYYATPLVDLEAVSMALRVPLRWKNAGILQSRLITALHPLIAAQDSAYGFPFNVGPGWMARLAEWMTCARPVSLRPLINATRRKLRNVEVAPALLQRYRTILPGEWQMDPLLDLARLPDATALGRALAVEVVWRRLLQGGGQV
ncbi:asparagine synthase [Rhodanobacter caeni]|uniref:Asparagine synthetase domain-containing protein n=1 Tax=Rhodanobacter caeni TaxID=657654 RepID=A0ABN0UJH6_9GAMM